MHNNLMMIAALLLAACSETGDAGPAGPEGQRGSDGTAGTRGPAGETGPRGLAGSGAVVWKNATGQEVAGATFVMGKLAYFDGAGRLWRLNTLTGVVRPWGTANGRFYADAACTTVTYRSKGSGEGRDDEPDLAGNTTFADETQTERTLHYIAADAVAQQLATTYVLDNTCVESGDASGEYFFPADTVQTIEAPPTTGIELGALHPELARDG